MDSRKHIEEAEAFIARSGVTEMLAHQSEKYALVAQTHALIAIAQCLVDLKEEKCAT